MAQEFPVNPSPQSPERPHSNNILVIVLVVLAVLCLCCLVSGGVGWSLFWYLWNNGDRIFGLAQLLPFLI